MSSSHDDSLRLMTGKLTTADRKARQAANEEGWKREQLLANRARAEKTARLATLRLAKEAADRAAAEALAASQPDKPAKAPRKPARPKAAK